MKIDLVVRSLQIGKNRLTMTDHFRKPGQYSKGDIRRAGERLAERSPRPGDEAIIQEWRDCHVYVLNTFQNTLRRWIRGRDYVLVQRLKRLSTVKDKLVTGRSNDVSAMHDLAGCRIIFPSVTDLLNFRQEFHSMTRSSHEYISAGKYDYLVNPKDTGYRGMHDVYKYRVPEGPGSAWNGLKVEIQYRTQAQHAWATAVEISDLIDKKRVKFDQGSDGDREQLFRMASEYIARNSEGVTGCLPDITDKALLRELKDLEYKLNVFARLKALSASQVTIPKSRNLVLSFSDRLTVKSYPSASLATQARNQLELVNSDLDVVYIRAEKPNQVAGAFRNYFRDAKGFLQLLPDFGVIK